MKWYMMKVTAIAKVTAPLKCGKNIVVPLMPLFFMSKMFFNINIEKKMKHNALLWIV
jgi:hypothetical protein